MHSHVLKRGGWMLLRLTDSELLKEIKKVGADPASFNIFIEKSEIIPLKFFNLPAPGANIVKQEMLSLGGDVVVHRNVVNCKIERSDIILLGTKKHYRMLVKKLEQMDCFELDILKKELEEFLNDSGKRSILLKNGKILPFERTFIMGIINVTPDSFYKESRKMKIDEILETAENMINDGADILDIGGMSTRPGSEPVELEEELKRVIPAIKAIKEAFPNTLVSVDTYRWRVAKEAIDVGADIVNDISALRFDENMGKLVADTNVPVVLMHIKGTPKTMQENPYYEDVTKEILRYFEERINYALSQGISEKRIILDPGIGFGKRLEDNLEILRRIEEFRSLGFPILIGASRKSFIGYILDKIPPEDRLEGTLAVTAWCCIKNVDIIRVHDVKENKRVLKIIESLKNFRV